MSFAVNNIRYRYNDEAPFVLDEVSFAIEPGQVTAIVGPSGCGKSTLVSILCTAIPDLLSTGTLSGSFDIPEGTLVSVVSQSPENQLFGYSTEDAIAFGMENLGFEPAYIGERMEYVLDLLNIQHLRKRSVSTLSGGQRQAVCIASVLAMEPDIMIMDEPVSSLDPSGKQLIQNVMHQLSQTGQTVVIVDNNLDWFSDIVHHVIGLSDGKLLFDGTREDFFRDPCVQEQLGVNVPQEAEIYRKLSALCPQLPGFYTYDGALEVLGRYITPQSRQYDLAAEPAYEPMLCAEHLNKTFDDGFSALIDVNANFAGNRVISILGQNGSGKTTLVKHLNGLLRPTSGSIRYEGQDTAGRSVAEISRDIILVFQHPEHMLFEESVYAEMTFCARMQNVAFEESEILAVLEEYDLLAYKEELPANLPMGNKHLLTILSVMFSSAKVVILDEPTLGMDYHLKRKLIRIIKDLTAKGKTVIIISHDIPLVFTVTDEIFILNNGIRKAHNAKEALAADAALFEEVRIDRPAVVRLSEHFGFETLCMDVDSFAQAAAQHIGSKNAGKDGAGK